ncbi:hypothetical protein [Corynebacterium sp. AOP12-C2-36]|uniref:hypothetical protein n=1 Tax=Corynebacterium sp. AOP12-C2-36 TaxID=3457723 RepID=UPI00403319D4
MPGLDDALNAATAATQVTGVEDYAVDPTTILVSSELADAVAALEGIRLPTLEPGTIDGDEEHIVALQRAVEAVNADGETIRSAVNDFALPGLQAAAAEQQAAAAAASSPTAALAAGVAGDQSSEVLLSTAAQMLGDITSDSPLGEGEDYESTERSEALDAEEDTDAASAGERSVEDSAADVATSVSSASAPTLPAAMTPAMSGMAPNPAGILGSLASSGMGQAVGMSGMPGSVVSGLGATPASTSTQTSSAGNSGGISRSELRSMVEEAKQRMGARSGGSSSTSASSSPSPSSTFSPSSSSPTPSSTPTTTSHAPQQSSGSGAGSGSAAKAEAPAGPATGRTVSGGSVDQSSATSRTAATSLSHATGGSSGASAGGAATGRGGMGGMGMMPPMGGMGAGGGGSSSGSKSKSGLDQIATQNPLLTGEWLRQGTVPTISAEGSTGNRDVTVTPVPRQPAPASGGMVDLSAMERWVK